MYTKNFSIREAISFGFRFFFKHFEIYCALLLISVLPFFLNIFLLRPENIRLTFFLILLNLIIYYLVSIAYRQVTLQLIHHGTISKNQILPSGLVIFKFLVAYYLMYHSIIAIGAIFLIIPGIYFLVKYEFVGLLIIDKNSSIIESFTKSSLLTYGCKWKLFFFNLLSILFALIPILYPFYIIAQIHVYNKLVQQTPLLSQGSN